MKKILFLVAIVVVFSANALKVDVVNSTQDSVTVRISGGACDDQAKTIAPGATGNFLWSGLCSNNTIDVDGLKGHAQYDFYGRNWTSLTGIFGSGALLIEPGNNMTPYVVRQKDAAVHKDPLSVKFYIRTLIK